MELIDRLQDLTNVDFECDSAVTEQVQLRSLLTQFIENEMRSCSVDIGGITPEYVQRTWGGRVAIDDIEAALEELKRSDDLLCIGK